jgi:hypothetical protein
MLVVFALATESEAEPLRLHPDNPHYFLFRGKPTVLITSGEHYGSVLNLDFDYHKYLETLARDKMNLTRTFTGVYCEAPGNFNIAGNTLAPAPGKLLCPWARSDQPGYANGGNKFDLTRFDDAWFHRLRDFMAAASKCGVVVEMNLFCPFYEDSMWKLSPLNPANNINALGPTVANDSYTLDRNGGLLPFQEALTRKIVAELSDFDNLYYEVMNEPYICNVPMDWQRHITEVIVDAEKPSRRRHLISLNIANQKAEVRDPPPAISIFNFHYAWPPETVGMNYSLGRVIGDNETGFVGTSDFVYRREGWAFVMAGGGLYNNLDYSFTADHEDGTFAYPPSQPGGGGAAFRRQLRTLADFMASFAFVRMAPHRDIINGTLPEGIHVEILAETGKQYAIYLCRNEPTDETAVTLKLDVPAGEYDPEWWHPQTGRISAKSTISHNGGELALTTPPFAEDLALRLTAAH